MRRTKNIRDYNISDFYCTNCGHKNFPVIRKPGRAKEPGHLKKLFCLYCNSEQNMVEIKQKGAYTLEDFLIEYNGGNFINGQRQMTYRQFIAKQKEGIKYEHN